MGQLLYQARCEDQDPSTWRREGCWELTSKVQQIMKAMNTVNAKLSRKRVADQFEGGLFVLVWQVTPRAKYISRFKDRLKKFLGSRSANGR